MTKKTPKPSNAVPLYQQVKLHVLKLIEQQNWRDDRRLPSENELVDLLSVSRMTVNRAFRELNSEGYITRVAGVGTFACEPKAQSHPLQILNIAEEINMRGHFHDCRVLDLKAVRATPEVAMQFSIAPGSRLFHSQILHLESDTPIQLEDRFVLPSFAPRYLETDFNQTTTTEYLLGIESSINEVEQIITAEIPSKHVEQQLDMQAHEPALVLTRRTWIDASVVTYSHLYHPSSRYRFASRYTPS